jgi:hypothetical protein
MEIRIYPMDIHFQATAQSIGLSTDCGSGEAGTEPDLRLLGLDVFFHSANSPFHVQSHLSEANHRSSLRDMR